MPILTPLRRGLICFNLYVVTLIAYLAASKLLMERFSFTEVLFLRNLAPFLAILGLIAIKRDLRPWKTARWSKHMVRGLIGFANMVMIYLSIKLLPLALAMTIRQMEAFIWVILASALYHEKASRRQWAALAVGFVGVLIILRPSMEANVLGTVIAAASAFAGAGVRVLSRDLSRTEDSATIIFFNFAQWTIISSLALPWSWTMPEATDWLPLFLVGVTILASQWLMTESMRLVPAPQLAPWRNSEIFWSGLVGWLIWRDPIGGWFIAGSTLIIAAGIAANWRVRAVDVSR